MEMAAFTDIIMIIALPEDKRDAFITEINCVANGEAPAV